MDLEKIGQFLAALRKERGLTQEQLGSRLGVTNKTVSRWEKGNYLPPAEMLRERSGLYGISINEMLSGERLAEERYREKAEENITAAVKKAEFTRREQLAAAGEWLRKNWWFLPVCLLPAAGMYLLLPYVVRGSMNGAFAAAALLALGLAVVANHAAFHVCKRGFEVTQRQDAFRSVGILRAVWLVILGVMAFVSVELLLALLYALTPAGNADGYAIHSMFYDILIEDGGIYPDNCFEAFRRTVWQTFGVLAVNLDLAVLWLRKK